MLFYGFRRSARPGCFCACCRSCFGVPVFRCNRVSIICTIPLAYMRRSMAFCAVGIVLYAYGLITSLCAFWGCCAACSAVGTCAAVGVMVIVSIYRKFLFAYMRPFSGRFVRGHALVWIAAFRSSGGRVVRCSMVPVPVWVWFAACRGSAVGLVSWVWFRFDYVTMTSWSVRHIEKCSTFCRCYQFRNIHQAIPKIH